MRTDILKFFGVVLFAGIAVWLEEKYLPLPLFIQSFIRFSVILILCYMLMDALNVWRLF